MLVLVLVLGGLGVSINGGPRTLTDSLFLRCSVDDGQADVGRGSDLVVGVPLHAELLLLVDRCQGDIHGRQ